jgi:hypothetical protein
LWRRLLDPDDCETFRYTEVSTRHEAVLQSSGGDYSVEAKCLKLPSNTFSYAIASKSVHISTACLPVLIR